MSHDAGEELAYREYIFRATVQEIEEHKYKYGAESWKGLNEFSAMTKVEFAKARLVPAFSANAVTCLANGSTVDAHKAGMPRPATPSSWDWVAQGVVSPVQNQGQCGSAWAFSTVAAIESAWAVNTSTLFKLSEQVRMATA
jgi:C1A family cysteine protease